MVQDGNHLTTTCNKIPEEEHITYSALVFNWANKSTNQESTSYTLQVLLL